MFAIIFKLFGLAFVVVMVAFMIANTFRKARRLDQRIREFKAEQEEQAKQPGPINPYAALAELYTDQMREEERRRKRRERR